MPRRGRRKRSYSCSYPPCIHVVLDDRRRLFKVFIEYDYDGGQSMIVSIDSSALSRACFELEYAKENGFREARDEEIDYLARKYLNIVKPVEYED